jgi:hypothetical protein
VAEVPGMDAMMVKITPTDVHVDVSQSQAHTSSQRDCMGVHVLQSNLLQCASTGAMKVLHKLLSL